jgi:hypothetical protein
VVGGKAVKMKQISAFVENEPGRLQALLEVLKSRNINIRALSVADHPDFGSIRFIVAEPEQATQALRDAGFTVRLTNVLAVEIPDQAGSLLDHVAEPLARNSINLEYFYAFIEPVPGKAMVVVKTSDQNRAEQVLG